MAPTSCLVPSLFLLPSSLWNPQKMVQLLQNCCGKYTINSVKVKTRRGVANRRAVLRPFLCLASGDDNRMVVVKGGMESIDICRVINGMWQTSGGWGSIDKDDAVDAMLRHADAGLATFDMADICMN